jgi:hypothetical protein
MASIEDVERITGFERRPSESVSEYLSRLGSAADVDEEEVDAVREAIHTELYSPDPLPEGGHERVRAFAETVSERAAAADVERTGADGAGDAATERGVDAVPDRSAGERAVETGGAGTGSGAAGTLESLAGRWDDASGSTRRKFLAGVGIAGTLGVGAAAAGVGLIGDSGDDGGEVAGRSSTTVAGAWAGGETGAGNGTETATEDAASEGASTTSAGTTRATLSEADVAVERYGLRELDRAEWPQNTPEVCRYPVDRLAEVPNLVYRDGASGLDPLASARRMLGILDCYEETGETAFLEKATEIGTALYGAGETVGEGVYLPHGFDANPHEEIDWPVEEPWYSATTQGVALSAFARLHAYRDGEAAWQYARSVLRSFDSVVTRAEGASPADPWIACVDGEHLWLEKYARFPASHVFSGHGVAAWGLYEAWAATGSELAAELFRASATTVRARAEAFRNEDEPSDFCLGHGARRPAYHRLHVGQLRTFHELTGDEAFEALAREFEADYES